MQGRLFITHSEPAEPKRRRAFSAAAAGAEQETAKSPVPPEAAADEPPWISVAELAKCLGTTSNAVRQWLGELPAEFKRNVGHRKKIVWQLRPKETVLWWAVHKAGILLAAGSPAGTLEAADNAADKLQAELRLLRVKVAQAEIDLQERIRELVPRSEVRQQLAGLAALHRQMSDHLVKRFGNEAALILENYLRAFEAFFDESSDAATSA